MAIYNQFTGELVGDINNPYEINPNTFAKKYVDATPMNPFLLTGIPDSLNPIKQTIYNPSFLKAAESSIRSMTEPQRQRTQRESTIPERINQFENVSQLNQELNQRGTLNSSFARSSRNLENVETTTKLNQITDQIKNLDSQTRNEFLTQLIREYQDIIINDLQTIVPNYTVIPTNVS